MRYAVVCFPVFMIFGMWGKHTAFDRVYTTFAAVLLGVFTVVSVNWIFVA
jgi:hypothetical protein